uniref:Uncharacterized protein n=1 Tax=Nicotiana tabacum TaxID=4097 RepID=A0A1S3XM37_TOBAC|nr:PREDICTED: uncharacterized protein LOC107766686 [Nicotiana tabacum]
MDSTTVSAQGPTSPAEELLKKIQELEADHAQLKQEMSKLMITYDYRSQQPPRCRAGGGFDGGAAAASLELYDHRSTYFRHLSPLERESSTDGHAAVKFTDRHYLNILDSMGQTLC